jgi:putative DNA primase/helicase
MDLFSARFGLTEEIPGGRELSMNKVKKIVGTPVLTARRMRCDPVEWEPTHALFVTTNTAPIVTSPDHGAWRRLAKVGFPIRYRKPGEPLEGPHDRRGDPSLSARMHAGDPALLEALLAWLIDGARRWYRAGRVLPPVPTQVADDTHAWRGETDTILRFADEKLKFEPGSCVLSTDLYEEYVLWAERETGRADPPKVFKSRFLEHSVALTAAVSAARTTKYDGLSRPTRKATAYWPAGQQYVITNVAFLKDAT